MMNAFAFEDVVLVYGCERRTMPSRHTFSPIARCGDDATFQVLIQHVLSVLVCICDNRSIFFC